ncbi:MAG: Metalloenzyme, LuxS/M16 peptidase-like protein [Olpidium bornovanus]|uniref:Metalloenzyme, LuxS/M16 peptidase-like protein n=1 Tax=Olpidium bornovanus TaxID=278681 RepID=A0A8H7ZZG1_9FUNG|nr:MAG: Metalloenzyme, LuxS/M16 peptidase-like protein [Olpidium bornovanus]
MPAPPVSRTLLLAAATGRNHRRLPAPLRSPPSQPAPPRPWPALSASARLLLARRRSRAAELYTARGLATPPSSSALRSFAAAAACGGRGLLPAAPAAERAALPTVAPGRARLPRSAFARSLMISAASDGRWRSSDPASPHQYKYFEDLQKPDTDDRKYRVLLLGNTLQALVISDPTSDKASASLDVKVGQLSDPPELQGLAHFCEHLLFMARHRQVSQGKRVLSGLFRTAKKTCGGRWGIVETVKPTSRIVVNAVVSFGPQSDGWRLHQLERSLSRAAHPYSKFGTGNLETLKESPEKFGLDIRNELLKFHGRHYSANIMRLVVLGRESVDELTKSVVEKFGSIVNKDVAVPSWPGSPWGNEEALRLIRVRPVKDMRLLEIAWPYPDQEEHFTSKPSQYIGHLLGHEGPGSILSYLKKKGKLYHCTRSIDSLAL